MRCLSGAVDPFNADVLMLLGVRYFALTSKVNKGLF